MTKPVEERFAEKYKVDPESGCWIWTACIAQNGYSNFRFSNQKKGTGHKYSYELHVGPIPEGAVLHHLCGNKACVNPEHLEAVTSRQHIVDRHPDSPAGANARKELCKRGHPLEGDNILIYRGRRRCNTCFEQWRSEHRDELIEYGRRHYRENREKRKAYQNAYYQRTKKKG